MKCRAVVLMMVIVALSLAAWAGEIEGRVTGMKGKSVVYVDAIAGKTFPAPKDHPVIDQKGLTFSPQARSAPTPSTRPALCPCFAMCIPI